MGGNSHLRSVHCRDQCVNGSLSAVGDRNLCDGHIRDYIFCGTFNGIGHLSGRAASLKGICGDQYVHVPFLPCIHSRTTVLSG